MNHPQISIVQDKRRAKKSGKFPVKLRVFIQHPRKQKLYATKFEFTEEEFNSTWETLRPRNQFKQNRRMLAALLEKANSISEAMEYFDFEVFEKKLYRKASDATRIEFHYKMRISELVNDGKISTSELYALTLKSIGRFLENRTGSVDTISFHDVSQRWLKEYEEFMLNEGKSITTVSIYLRTLKTTFNRARENGDIPKELFPFGKNKYKIPNVRNNKRALSNEQLKVLLEAQPKTKDQREAKDMWFFSFCCNGMNIKDILLLKNKNIRYDTIEFIRAKTSGTTRASQRPIKVYLNDFSKEILKKYRAKNANPDAYVFSKLQGISDPKRLNVAIKNYTRFVNQHIKAICVDNGLPEISTYWARHSFSTTAIRKGASMEFVQESLGHKNIRTTMNYFAGFDDDVKRDFAETLLDF